MLGSTYYENEAKSEMNPLVYGQKRDNPLYESYQGSNVLNFNSFNNFELYLSINNIQFRLSFEGHKSLEYCCLELNFASISRIVYGDLIGGIFA